MRHQRLPVHPYVGDEYHEVLQLVSTSANVEEVEQYSIKYNEVKDRLLHLGDAGPLAVPYEAVPVASPSVVLCESVRVSRAPKAQSTRSPRAGGVHIRCQFSASTSTPWPPHS